jgi:hypothetical protein
MGGRHSGIKRERRIDILTFCSPLGMAVLDIIRKEANKEDSSLFNGTALKGEKFETTEIFNMLKDDLDKNKK